MCGRVPDAELLYTIDVALYEKIPAWAYATGIAGVFVVLVGSMYAMGHVPICKCGYIKLWHGIVVSSENSQHISDWYSFSHIIHGFIFYWIAWLLFPKSPVLFRLLLALSVEVAWELFENTDFIINRYREATISLDYYGDSIINSVMDTAFALLGFLMAWRLPIVITIALMLAMEICVGWYIHDNLLLNIIMLIHPFQFILDWQAST